MSKQAKSKGNTESRRPKSRQTQEARDKKRKFEMLKSFGGGVNREFWHREVRP